MAHYNSTNAKISDSQLSKLKSAIKMRPELFYKFLTIIKH